MSLALLLLTGGAAATGLQHGFCGLARTVNGFDYVRATDLGCGDALVVAARIERGLRDAWACSRSVGGSVELACASGGRRIELLERSPMPALRHEGVVTLANWSFRVHRRVLEAREDARGWITLGHAPWCVPDAPREALLALRLRPLTRNGGCFTLRDR